VKIKWIKIRVYLPGVYYSSWPPAPMLRKECTLWIKIPVCEMKSKINALLKPELDKRYREIMPTLSLQKLIPAVALTAPRQHARVLSNYTLKSENLIFYQIYSYWGVRNNIRYDFNESIQCDCIGGINWQKNSASQILWYRLLKKMAVLYYADFFPNVHCTIVQIGHKQILC
jgi:hypothetical protein